MNRALLALTLLHLSLACRPEEERPDYVTPKGPPTDTVPSFHGRVPRNLVMLSIDTFRKDHLTRYGGPSLTPMLDDLAANGFAFDNHLSCSNWTFHATTCALAGRHPQDMGWVAKLVKDGDEPVPAGTPLLASWLSQADFATVLVSNNEWLSEKWGSGQGYQRFVSPNDGSALGSYREGLAALRPLLEQHDRFFLHLHILEPHASYNPPEAYLTGLADLDPLPVDLTDRDEHYELRDEWPDLDPALQELLNQHLQLRYRGEIQWTDEQIRLIIEDLGFQGLLQDTLVVIWNDHGEAFWEHGKQTHAYDLYRPENDGVLVFWAPNIIPGSTNLPSSHIDLVPTLLELFGIDRPAEVTGQAASALDPDRPRFADAMARSGVVHSVVQGEDKLIYYWNGRIEQYRLDLDPLEQTNRFDPEDPRSRELWDLLLPRVQAMIPLIPERGINWPDGLPRGDAP